MTAQKAPSLEQQRQEVLDRLQAQRERIALQLAPVAQRPPGYPRSFLMRLILSRPELVVTVLAFIVSRFMQRRPPSP